MVPFVSQNAAVASQAFCNPLWGLEGIDRLNKGENANDIMSDFIKRDSGQSIRQAHMIDIYGNLHAHTGSDCVDWAGHASANRLDLRHGLLPCMVQYQWEQAHNLRLPELLNHRVTLSSLHAQMLFPVLLLKN